MQGSQAREAAIRAARRYAALLVEQAREEVRKAAAPLDASLRRLTRELARSRVDRDKCRREAERATERLRRLLAVVEAVARSVEGAHVGLRGEALQEVVEPAPNAPGARVDEASEAPEPSRTDLRLDIPARRVGQRFTIAIGGREADLRLAQFMVLLLLVVGRLQPGGPWVHRKDLGARTERGWKGVLRLNEAVAGLLPTGMPIVEKATGGYYRLNEAIGIGAFDLARIAEVGPRAAALAREIRATAPASDSR